MCVKEVSFIIRAQSCKWVWANVASLSSQLHCYFQSGDTYGVFQVILETSQCDGRQQTDSPECSSFGPSFQFH